RQHGRDVRDHRRDDSRAVPPRRKNSRPHQPGEDAGLHRRQPAALDRALPQLVPPRSDGPDVRHRVRLHPGHRNHPPRVDRLSADSAHRGDRRMTELLPEMLQALAALVAAAAVAALAYGLYAIYAALYQRYLAQLGAQDAAL